MKSLAVIALLFVSLAAAAQTIPVLPQLPDPVVPLPVAPAPQPITPAPTPVPLTPVPQAAAAENVWVKGTYLTDSDGYQYGMSFTVNSNYSVEVCVFPYVKDSDNVNGAVTPGPIQLKPGETGFGIGQFNSADENKPWSVHVGAKFHTGSC